MVQGPLRSAIRNARYSILRTLKRTWVDRRIWQLDTRKIPDNDRELRAFIVVRNESLRLPFLLEHYFSRGVDRIIVLDNGSTDDTVEIVLERDNTHVFRTLDNFKWKRYWVDHLLRQYGMRCWSLVLDADEVLVYPCSEVVDIPQLCQFLDNENFDALDAILLDMYPRSHVGELRYMPGTDPGLIAGWFDSGPYDKVADSPVDLPHLDMVYRGPPRHMGGMRERVFGVSPCISKFPLVKFNRSMFMSTGAHFLSGARPATVRGALLHYKYLHDFEENVRREARRGVYWNNAFEYKEYLATLSARPDLRFTSEISTKYSGTDQLLSLGILRSSESYERYVRGLSQCGARTL